MKLPSLFPVVFFAAGTFLARRLQDHLYPSLRICLGAVLLLLFAGYIALRGNRLLLATAFAAMAWLSLGLTAARLERASVPANLASALIESGKLDASTPLRWRGRLRTDPLALPWGGRYEINLEEVESAGKSIPVSGGLRLTYYREERPHSDPPPARAGDRIEVFARALPIGNFGDPGAFDYRTYLGFQNIQLQGSLRNGQLLTILDQPRLTLADRFARLRGRFLSAVDDLLASRPDEAALARAMLLGDRSFVEHDRVVEFQRTGVYHVLVLAGLHVGALAAFCLWAGRFLRWPLLPRIALTLTALGAYAFIVEDRPPIIRAVLMATLYLCAQVLYRRTDLLNVAALSALVILAARPSEIRDASFLLSYSAVATIGAIGAPLITRWTEPHRYGLEHLSDVTRDVSHAPRIIQFRIEMRAVAAWLAARAPSFAARFILGFVIRPLQAALYLADIILLSVILQLGMLPALAYYFHRVTLAGPLANIPALLLTGILVPLGFLMLGFSLVSHAIAAWLAKTLGFLLALLEYTVGWFSRWTGASYRVPEPPLLLIAVFVVLAIGLSLAIRNRWSAKWISITAAALLTAALVIATHPFPPKLAPSILELTVLDVSQGDSLFLSFPRGHTMLVDAGGELGNFHLGGMRSGIDIGEDVVSPYLWSRGIKRIDIVALTHAHEDHLGGLPAILENFGVQELWVGRDIRSAAYQHVLAVARARGVWIRQMKQGDTFFEDGVSGSVLWPEDLSDSDTAKNDDSLVMRLNDGSESMLLAGDIERPSERQILSDRQDVRVNFLKVAHHGSKTSTTETFLSAMHPAIGAISVGRDNSFGHPSPEVIERLVAAGVRVYRTDRDGAITVRTDGANLSVDTYLHTRK